jgi:predicted nucleic acid-binding protein
MNAVLIDAGPLVAILHADDQDHAACVQALRRIRSPLVTTWPPLTEAMYLLSFAPEAQDALVQMVERSALHLMDLSVEDLSHVRVLMRKYRSLLMDFADATLVHVAEREDVRRIFTLDRRDFAGYRLGARGAAFSIVP